MRRTLVIIAGIIALILIGVGIYFFVFRKAPALTGETGNTLPTAGNAANSPDATTPPAQELGVPLPGAGTDIAPRLVRIADRPVALGSVAVYVPAVAQQATTTASSTSNAGTEADVRVEYIEKESGNVYAYQAHARTLTRLSNKTLPGIQEATWLSDGSLAFVRFLTEDGSNELLNTYALPSNGEGGYFLEQGLSQLIAKDTNSIATLLSTSDGSSVTVSTPSGTSVHTLFSSPLSSLRIAFAGTNYVATTKGSSESDGYAFLVDGKSGIFTRLLGPLQSLSTLPSPSGNLLLYSYLDRGKLALAVLDLSTHVATRLPVATLPEKCVWTADSTNVYCGIPTAFTGKLPEDWYQGAVSFSDRLWRINMSDRVATLLIDPKQAGGLDADMVGLAVDRTSDMLVFKNKRDGLLYVYDL